MCNLTLHSYSSCFDSILLDSVSLVRWCQLGFGEENFVKKVWVICWEDMYLLVNLFKEVSDNSSGVDDPKFI